MQRARTPKGGVDGWLGIPDAHDDGRIGRIYLRRLYLRENALISGGIKHQCSEIALINEEWV